MNPDQTTIFYGPPGTGKTTALIGKMEQLLKSGHYQPEEIAYFSFTRGAAEVALARAMQATRAPQDRFPLFRTLHSMAANLTPKAGTYMTPQDWRDVAKSCGLTCEKWLRASTSVGSATEETKGDVLFTLLEASRHSGVGFEHAAATGHAWGITVRDLEYVSAKVHEYKQAYGKRDFTDLIESYLKEGWWPKGLRIMIVDEAQDLSILQWAMVRKLATHCEHVYIAGDDDQSIYRWAGASPETFISLQGQKEFLTQSYRVKWGAHRLANLVTQQIQNRQPKDWKPSPAEAYDLFEAADLGTLNLDQGHWLILCRTSSIVTRVVERLSMLGIRASGRHTGIEDTAGLQLAMRAWHRLQAGWQIKASSAKALYSFATGCYNRKGFRVKLNAVHDSERLDLNRLTNEFGWKVGAHWKWYQVFRTVIARSPAYRDFVVDTQKKIEDGTLRIDWSVEVDTIHSAKGDERDNVIVVTDIPYRIRNTMQSNSPELIDDEWRVWYVAVTRAKHRLYILQPLSTKTHYFHELHTLLGYVRHNASPAALSHDALSASGEDPERELAPA